MNKIIAISLWGDNPRYSIGAIKNAELAEKYFPGWKLRIYYDNSVEEKTISDLNQFSWVETINCERLKNIAPYFWRFLSAFEDDNNIVLLRDSDSRLSRREKDCVDKWLISDKKYIIIRDHIRHYDFPMLAGMWGHKGKPSTTIFEQMMEYAKKSYYTVDQEFLRSCVWPEAEQNSNIFGIVEDECFRNSRQNILPHFVGQGYDENNTPIYPVE